VESLKATTRWPFAARVMAAVFWVSRGFEPSARGVVHQDVTGRQQIARLQFLQQQSALETAR
jgi:hypothetical protein